MANSFGGTSASTPIFSSVITRINEERLNVGKKPIGFLNPSLYANPSMLNDVTNGMHNPVLSILQILPYSESVPLPLRDTD